jgi:hypothetical protein
VFSLPLLKHCKEEMNHYSPEANRKAEEMVRSKFNTRVVIEDITNHPYLNLLDSRSYFNLIFIEEQILSRYETFKKTIFTNYNHIYNMLTLNNFILLDDYVHIA